MKTMVTFIFMTFLSLSSFAVDTKTQCHTVADEVDRDYCHRKRMQVMKKEMAKEKLTWATTLTAAAKLQKQNELKLKIAQKQAQLKMISDELKLDRAHESDLNAAKEVAARRKKKKKKKKKKRSSLEKALNIRL